MRAIILCAAFALSGCTWNGHGCDEGVPRDWTPKILHDDAGNRYFVALYTGCTFTVRQVSEIHSKDSSK